jgi:hypothetical protein
MSHWELRMHTSTLPRIYTEPDTGRGASLFGKCKDEGSIRAVTLTTLSHHQMRKEVVPGKGKLYTLYIRLARTVPRQPQQHELDPAAQ